MSGNLNSGGFRPETDKKKIISSGFHFTTDEENGKNNIGGFALQLIKKKENFSWGMEKMIPGTPQEYANIYIDCWYSELEKCPKLVGILNNLDNLSTEQFAKLSLMIFIQKNSNQILATTIFSDAKQNISKVEFDKESLINKSEVKSNDVHVLESSSKTKSLEIQDKNPNATLFEISIKCGM
ncbi:20742_t:CDS:2, partial [Dentiscutata erythropus]